MLDVFLGVSSGSKFRLFRPISQILRCSVFQVVAPGYCQTTVKGPCVAALVNAIANCCRIRKVSWRASSSSLSQRIGTLQPESSRAEA